jgi:hypothetical protein
LRKEFVGTNGENSLETRIHRELTRKKNGTYFLVKDKTTDLGITP